jgi:PHD/YefM family antitoxin component YafN of YafNO toxin-antitoxin module
VIPKTVSPTELRQNLYAIVREVASKGHRYLITPNEGDAVVMCSREDFNALIAERQLLRDIRDAEAEIAAGRTFSSTEVRASIGRVDRKALSGKRTKR